MLHVSDIDAERDRPVAKGVDAPPIAEEPRGQYIMISDPDGSGWVVTTQTVVD